MKNSEENKLRQYIFGQAFPEERQGRQGVPKKGRERLDSSFQDWKLIFWEECFATSTCKMTQYAAKIFGLPETCENFPNCLFGKGVLSQQTEAAFRRAEYRLRAGEEHFTFEAIVNSSADMPKWLEIECSLELDEEGLPAYAVGIAHDISSKKMLEQKYQDQIAYRNGLCANTLNCMRIDLTEDSITEYNTPVGEITEMCALFPTADACLRKITEDMVRASDIEKYKDVLTTQGLVDAYNAGQNNVVVEYYDTMFRKWLRISFVILKNPSNSHIDCFGICTDISATKLLETALNNVTKQDYTLVGIIDTLAKDYLYLTDHAEGPVLNTFDSLEAISTFILKEMYRDYPGLETLLTREKLNAALAEKREYSVVFNGENNEKRYQIYFLRIEEDEHLVMVAVRDITDDALLEKLRYDAEHDALTGLYNRGKAFEQSNILLARHPKEKFAVAHFDVQKFRLYNSFFGEKEGDCLLKFIAAAIRELCGKFPYSVYGHIEADVFFVCLPYREDLLEKVEGFLRDRLANYRSDFQVTGNCGLYITEEHTLSAEAMFNRAAIVAKDNKTKQLNPVKVFDVSEENRLNNEHEIALDMHRAIEEKQFAVYLQPKYKLLTGEAFGAEALVRWLHPRKGLIMPGEFIPLFETNGFIIQLDQYMWEQVCILIHKWLAEGRKPCPVSVNMSRVSMYSPQTVPFLKGLVDKYGIPPELLNLELTESAYMDAPEEMKRRLNELRGYGFLIMMDDFGSGYSSLNTLREIPVDYLKVDRVFLASVDSDKRSRLVLSSVVHMASMMGIPVVTEGVETESQREFLSSIGCDFIQGFLYAKPMPVADYEQRVMDARQGCQPSLPVLDGRAAAEMMNADADVSKFANLLPYPVAFVEYRGNAFAYMSANRAFMETFGMHRDIMEKEELLAQHLTADAYKTLQSLYRKTSESGTPGQCLLRWRHLDGKDAYYTIKAQYVGKNDYAVVLTSSFVDVSEFIGEHGAAQAAEGAPAVINAE